MSIDQRLNAAVTTFDEKFGWSEDEWTELFHNAAELAYDLTEMDSPEDTALLHALLVWLENAANLPAE